MGVGRNTHVKLKEAGIKHALYVLVPDIVLGGAAASARTSAGANSHINNVLTGDVLLANAAVSIESLWLGSQCTSTRISDEHDDCARAAGGCKCTA